MTFEVLEVPRLELLQQARRKRTRRRNQDIVEGIRSGAADCFPARLADSPRALPGPARGRGHRRSPCDVLVIATLRDVLRRRLAIVRPKRKVDTLQLLIQTGSFFESRRREPQPFHPRAPALQRFGAHDAKREHGPGFQRPLRGAFRHEWGATERTLVRGDMGRQRGRGAAARAGDHRRLERLARAHQRIEVVLKVELLRSVALALLAVRPVAHRRDGDSRDRQVLRPPSRTKATRRTACD